MSVCALIIFSIVTALYVGNMAPGKAGRRLAFWWQQHAPWKSINIKTDSEARKGAVWSYLQEAPERAKVDVDVDSSGEKNISLPTTHMHTPTRDEEGNQSNIKNHAAGSMKGEIHISGQHSHEKVIVPTEPTSKKTSRKRRGEKQQIQHSNNHEAGDDTVQPESHKAVEQERFAWSRAWSADSVQAIYLELVNKNYNNTSCSANMPHIIMHKINGSALTTTMQTHAKVITASPASLLSVWNQTSLASEFVYGEERWIGGAIDSVKHMPIHVITSTRSSAPHRDFGAYLHHGDTVLAASQLSAHRNISGMAVREPWPGLMVMYNARFWTRSVFVNDCRIVYASCCW